MTVTSLDIAQIAQLGTQVAQSGAIRAFAVSGDEIFDYIIGIVFLVYAMDPDLG